MKSNGTLIFEFEGRDIAIEYNVFYYANAHYIDLTDKHGDRHRFKRLNGEWIYSSLRPLKWRYDFTKRLFNAMDAVIKELAL